MKTRDDYMSKVEQGNLYIDKLLALEEKYFTQKYGPEIYNYMLQQRKGSWILKILGVKQVCLLILLTDHRGHGLSCA